MVHFLTSRYGKLDSFVVYKYDFDVDLTEVEKRKLFSWLKKATRFYELTENYIKTFQPLTESKQYKFDKQEFFLAPFSNLPQISSFLSYLTLKSLEKEYPQYQNQNMVIVDNEVHQEFMFLKCINFNIEVFSSGRFYVHFIPKSKIISAHQPTKELLTKLSKKIPIQIDNVKISVRSRSSRSSITRDLTDKDDRIDLISFISKHEEEDLFATFNSRSLSQIDKLIYGAFKEYTKNLIQNEVSILQKISSLLNFPIGQLYKKPFFKFEPKQPDSFKNLIVGENKTVEKQSAAYHHGIYKCASYSEIRPILFDNEYSIKDFQKFTELVRRYNGKNGKENNLKSITYLQLNEIGEDFELPDYLYNKTKGKKTLVVIFSKYTLPNVFFKQLSKHRINFQIYQGEIAPYRLDNFVVKCLTKLGGQLSIIKDTNEPSTTYFIGLDLGHSKVKEISKLGVTCFTNRGELFFQDTIESMLNEALNPFLLQSIFSSLRETFIHKQLPVPKKIIIHRDGKNHKYDINRILDALILELNVCVVDVVEIIKSGFPAIGTFHENSYGLPNSGSYFLDRDEDYALLITNTQKRDKGSKQILRPIVIKRKYGYTPFRNIIEQVFWFTKVYTNNLYTSSRLPATTEKANNIAGMGLTKHISKYLG